MPETPRVQLQDRSGLPATSTGTLVAGLAGRLATLRLVTGADAIGALTAGYAALGRRVARTAPGARLREALLCSRVAANGQQVWAALGIEQLATRPPTAVMDDLRADVALLLADDLEQALAELPLIPPVPRPDEDDDPASFVDYLIGMWAFASETARTIEAIAAATQPPRVQPADAWDDAPPGDPNRPLLQ